MATAILMVLVLLFDYVLETAFLYQHLRPMWTIINSTLLFFVLLFAFIAGRMDPGYLRSPKKY